MRILRLIMAAFVGLVCIAPASADFDQPGFNPNGSRCRFLAERSFYGYDPAATQLNAEGRLLIEWQPVTGLVTKYEWYYYARSDGGPYSTLTPSPAVAPTLARDFTGSGRWELAAWVNTNASATSSTPGHRVTAQLYPNGGAAGSAWIFSGILEQTGSGTINAAGTLSCDP